jgi:hypothetical protein
MSYRGRITQESRDQRFKEMWGKHPRHVIAKKLGFCNVDNVSHTAKRLNLPPLLELRYREGTRDISAAQKANRKRNAEKRAASRRRRRAGMNGRSDNPEPQMWRCNCGQICLTGPSHERCKEAA